MILFTILLVTLIVLTMIAIVVVSIFGAGAIVVFGDVIVCIFIIAWIMKLLIGRK